MKRSVIVGSLLLLLVVLVIPPAALALTASPSEILANPERYDDKLITTSGAITNVKPRVSRKSNAYYTFELHDGKRGITVFSFGEPPCSNGAQAGVEGQFQMIKRVGRYTFRNQVDATSVRCR